MNLTTLNPFKFKPVRSVQAAFAISGKACLLAAMCIASSSIMALQLGKHRGAAVIGQALNIAVQATIDSPDELGAGCLDADVFYADNRVDRSRVRVSTEKSAGNPQEVLIRIRATLPIDEPVVTVYLRTGCVQKMEKRYVVLADVLSESATSGASVAPALPARVPGGAAGTGVAPQQAASPDSGAIASPATARDRRRIEQEAQREDTRKRAAARPAAVDASPAAQPPAEAASPSLPSKPPRNLKTEKKPAADKPVSRLKLEPLELLAERDPTLKPSSELRTSPTNDPAQRSAAAALWRAIAARPEDILSDSQKLKTLESTVAGLQIQVKKNQQDMQNLGGDIDKARTDKYANFLMYGLGFLLLVAIAAGVWLLGKRFRSPSNTAMIQPWWRKDSGQQVGWADSANGPKASASSYGFGLDGTQLPRSSGQAPSSANYLDLDLSDAGVSGDGTRAGSRSGAPAGRSGSGNSARASRVDASLLASPSASRKSSTRKQAMSDEPTVGLRADFTQSLSQAGRAVKAEELFDVQQQADFFVSLGQKDQAVEVLRTHIEESEETSALVYLDLIKLYHQLGEQLEFEAFRQEFNARFNAEMPEFEAYSESANGAGLEAYPLAMSRIVALWPSAKVLNVIEESMFRQPDSQTTTFDLEAYRELLLLYAMIKDILHGQSLGKGPTVALPQSRKLQGMQTVFNENGIEQASTEPERGSNFPMTAIVPLATSREVSAFNTDIDVDIDVDIGGEAATDADDGLKRAVAGNSIDFDFDQPARVSLTNKKNGGRSTL